MSEPTQPDEAVTDIKNQADLDAERAKVRHADVTPKDPSIANQNEGADIPGRVVENPGYLETSEGEKVTPPPVYVEKAKEAEEKLADKGETLSDEEQKRIAESGGKEYPPAKYHEVAEQAEKAEAAEEPKPADRPAESPTQDAPVKTETPQQTETHHHKKHKKAA